MESQKIYRRFIPIGTEEEMKKLDELIADKDLSKADLVLILNCLEKTEFLYLKTFMFLSLCKILDENKILKCENKKNKATIEFQNGFIDGINAK